MFLPNSTLQLQPLARLFECHSFLDIVIIKDYKICYISNFTRISN